MYTSLASKTTAVACADALEISHKSFLIVNYNSSGVMHLYFIVSYRRYF